MIDWLYLFIAPVERWLLPSTAALGPMTPKNPGRDCHPGAATAQAEDRARNGVRRFEFDVFLCHNSKDKPAVREIGEQLIAKGIAPWLDEWHLRPGLPWQRALEEEIQEIKAAAVFVGDSGLGPWQDVELDAFLREFVRRRCPVIPVILGNCKTVPTLPLFLGGMTWVDFREQSPDPLDRLVWGITGKRIFQENRGNSVVSLGDLKGGSQEPQPQLNVKSGRQKSGTLTDVPIRFGKNLKGLSFFMLFVVGVFSSVLLYILSSASVFEKKISTDRFEKTTLSIHSLTEEVKKETTSKANTTMVSSVDAPLPVKDGRLLNKPPSTNVSDRLRAYENNRLKACSEDGSLLKGPLSPDGGVLDHKLFSTSSGGVNSRAANDSLTSYSSGTVYSSVLPRYDMDLLKPYSATLPDGLLSPNGGVLDHTLFSASSGAVSSLSLAGNDSLKSYSSGSVYSSVFPRHDMDLLKAYSATLPDGLLSPNGGVLDHTLFSTSSGAVSSLSLAGNDLLKSYSSGSVYSSVFPYDMDLLKAYSATLPEGLLSLGPVGIPDSHF